MKSGVFKRAAWVVTAVVAVLAGTTSTVFAFNIDRGVEGYWWQPELDARRGWSFQYLKTGPEQGSLFVTGFVYDAEGNAFWVTGNTTVIPGQYEVDITLLLLEGGSFGPDAGTPVGKLHRA